MKLGIHSLFPISPKERGGKLTLTFIRILFMMLSIITGLHLGTSLPIFVEQGFMGALSGLVLGIAGALFIILGEMTLKRISIKGLSAAFFGLVFGFILARLFIDVFELLPSINPELAPHLRRVVILMFCYLGMTIAVRGKDEFNLVIPYVKFSRQGQKNEFIVLDTSVIIDGRIADICHTKFMEGKLIIPRFVLNELQAIADSHDTLKRNRGRRGLDVLNKIQKSTDIDVTIHDTDFPELKEVDSKLVKLAKLIDAKIFTNDYNLNKVAELQGVPVLNIHELANVLKPVVLPGEMMEVKIIKEGKEFNQGVGYLDDGTMIVVDNARDKINRTLQVTVSSVLQTQAGKMIFAKSEKDNGKQ